MAIMRARNSRTWLFVGLTVGVVVVGALVLGRVAHRGPFAPMPWTNVKTGQIAGPRYVGITVPYESSKGCASGGYTSLAQLSACSKVFADAATALCLAPGQLGKQRTN